MDETREALLVTMRHPTSGHTLDKRRARMLYHHPDDPEGSYCGEIVSGIYFWCNTCGKGFMTTLQFANEEFKVEARRYRFVLASSKIPLQHVPWIKK